MAWEQFERDGGAAVAEVPQVFERALRRVDVVAEFIGAGPITGSITNVVIEHQGAPVTEVPEGESFDVYVHYQANNPGAYRWGTCATMITTDGKLPNFDIAGEWGASASGRMKLDSMGKPGPMPDHDITLRVKLWGNQEAVGTPPPQTEW